MELRDGWIHLPLSRKREASGTGRMGEACVYAMPFYRAVDSFSSRGTESQPSGLLASSSLDGVASRNRSIGSLPARFASIFTNRSG
jgi:hypothetical protein